MQERPGGVYDWAPRAWTQLLVKAAGVRVVRAYGQEPFVHVLPFGAVPQTRHVRGSNMTFIGVAKDRVSGRVQFLFTPTADFNARISADLEPHASQVQNGLTFYHNQPDRFAEAALEGVPKHFLPDLRPVLLRDHLEIGKTIDDGVEAARAVPRVGVGHDAEVTGSEPCVMVDFGEIGDYAKPS